MKTVTAVLAIAFLAATAAEAGDRFWDRDNFRGARRAYQKDLQALPERERRPDHPYARRHRLPPRHPLLIYREAPPVIFVEPAEPIAVVPVSPPFIDALGRSCLKVRTAESLGVACLHADGSWRLVS